MTVGLYLRFGVAEKHVCLVAVRRALGLKAQWTETSLCWHSSCLALTLLFLKFIL